MIFINLNQEAVFMIGIIISILRGNEVYNFF